MSWQVASTHTASYCKGRRNAGFLESLMEAHQLEVPNDDSKTRTVGEIHSIIDLTLANKKGRPFCLGWRILKAGDITTESNHEVVEWRRSGTVLEVGKSWKINGWALRARLDKEKRRIRKGIRGQDRGCLEKKDWGVLATAGDVGGQQRGSRRGHLASFPPSTSERRQLSAGLV